MRLARNTLFLVNAHACDFAGSIYEVVDLARYLFYAVPDKNTMRQGLNNYTYKPIDEMKVSGT